MITNTPSAFKCVMLGDAGIGKTSLLQRFIHHYFDADTSEPTIGAAYAHRTVQRDGQNYTIDFWDTAGCERYRSLMPMYYRHASAIFICVDLTSEECLDSLRRWTEELENHQMGNALQFVVGTKCDVETEHVAANVSMLEQTAPNRSLLFITSAKTNTNVDSLFSTMFDKVIDIKRIQQATFDAIRQDPQIDLTDYKSQDFYDTDSKTRCWC